jgi:AAA+ superfamily predicted ATPase
MGSLQIINPVNILSKVIILKDSPLGESGEIKHGTSIKSETKHDMTSQKPISINKDLAQEMSLLITHPDFIEYKLTHIDVLCIAQLWKKHLDSISSSLAWNTLSSGVGLNILSTNTCLDYIISLLERNIIAFDENIKSDYHINPIILLSAEYVLNSELILKILGRIIPQEIDKLISSNWQSDLDFIYDLKQCMGTMFNCFGEIDTNYRRKGKTMQSHMFYKCIRPLLGKLSKQTSSLAITKLIHEHQLDEIEVCILLLVLYTQLTQDDNISERELLLIICKDSLEHKQYTDYLTLNGKLLKQGLLEINDITAFVNRRELSVPDEIKNLLCAEGRTESESKLSYYLNQSSALQVIKTDQSLDELILPDKDKQLLNAITRQYQQNTCSDLPQRVSATNNDRCKSTDKGMVILFYGEPGTGKTFAAGALANSLHKDLVCVNCTELRNKYYSESEKLVKRAFILMRKMTAELDNPPVFLINEADQLIHNRSTNTNDCSRTDNAIQNIILEELESFPGILVLTTNLECNIDEAYYRRFNLKVKFNHPDKDCRVKLWQLHLNQMGLGYEDIDIAYLGKTYPFTGGQIALVVKNSCQEALIQSNAKQCLTMSKIIRYADLEQPWVSNKQRKSVGF